MPTDKDLFVEEQQMVTMSFGDHIEELRARLILALMGLFVGVVITFVPPLNLGWRIMTKMQEPAQQELTKFYTKQAQSRAQEAREAEAVSTPVRAIIPADVFFEQVRKLAPRLDLPSPDQLKYKTIEVPMSYALEGIIPIINEGSRPANALISLAPLETITIFCMVCVVAGLVVASPWVFYQVWAFIAAGLYRHERHYVTKFLPFSLGLFLTGVFLCFFAVLPTTLSFLLKFNVWLGIEPTLRLSDWMSFATILPLVFGVCFQTPLIMLFLSLIGIFTAADYKSKFRIAILIIFIVGAVLTPGPDMFSQFMLAMPMIMLYGLGILLVASREKKQALADVSG
jgi:sec-independent protein translocase protein TatC